MAGNKQEMAKYLERKMLRWNLTFRQFQDSLHFLFGPLIKATPPMAYVQSTTTVRVKTCGCPKHSWDSSCPFPAHGVWPVWPQPIAVVPILWLGTWISAPSMSPPHFLLCLRPSLLPFSPWWEGGGHQLFRVTAKLPESSGFTMTSGSPARGNPLCFRFFH